MLKLWLVKGNRVEPTDEQSDRYSWNGTCLMLNAPEYINDITPTYKTELRESIDGTPYVFTDSHAERFDLILAFRMNEKELFALREFMYAVSKNKRSDKGTEFNHPYMYYSGLEDICDIAMPDSDYVMFFLPQDLEFTEYTTDESVPPKKEDRTYTTRKYEVKFGVRIARAMDLRGIKDQYVVKLVWPDEEPEGGGDPIPGANISLGYDYTKVNNEVIYGWLTNLSGLSANSAIDGFGAVSNVTVSIAAFMQYNELDEDHPLRNIDKHIDTITEATAEVWYNNRILFKGKPYTPYTWDSATQEISFDCVMNAESKEMGYQIDYDETNPLFKSTQNWPHAFGALLMDVEPLCKTPESTLRADIYVAFNYEDVENNVYVSGTSFGLPLKPEDFWSLPTGEHHWLLVGDFGAIRLKGSIGVGTTLNITEFNIPWLCVPSEDIGYAIAELQVVEMIQYETGYVDSVNYQPNTLVINEDDVPYMVGKHIRAEAYKWIYTVNAQGRIVPEKLTFHYWATIVDQNYNIIYINNITEEAQNREIMLSGWITTKITHVMENRVFTPLSFNLLPAPAVKDARSTNSSLEQRISNLEVMNAVTYNNQFGYYLDQYLVLHLKNGTKVYCTDWLFDKLYPISLDAITNVTNVFQDINHHLYPVPVQSVNAWKDETLIPVQYEVGPWVQPTNIWELQEIYKYLPEECTFMILYDTYMKVQADVENELVTDDLVFDFIVEKYMDLEALPYDYAPNLQLSTNFYTRDKRDVRGWLSDFAKERGKRIVVHMNRTTELLPIFTGTDSLEPTWEVLEIDPVYTYTKKNIEANSISFTSTGVEDIINKNIITIPVIDDAIILKGDQKYPEAESSYTIHSYWRYEVWRYWINRLSKVWRKIQFRTFLTHNLPSPLETIYIDTDIFKGRCLVESVSIDKFSVTIIAFTEEEVI